MKNLILNIFILSLFVSSSLIYSSTKINIVSKSKPYGYLDTKSDKNVEIQSTKFPALHDSISSNVNFELGIGYNLILMFVNEYNSQNKAVGNSIKPSPLDILFSIGLRFRQNYDINFRFGFDEIYEDFGGYNAGLFFESSLFDSNIYGTFGIDFYNNFGNSHNSSESGGNFIFYCLGVEYRANKNITWNLIYWIPNNRVFGTNYIFKDNKTISFNKINRGLLKIGFQYSFIF